MKIVLEYDFIRQTVSIVENDFTTFEAFGILEAAKSMIAANWHGIAADDDDDDGIAV